jgi:hypothetical protein
MNFMLFFRDLKSSTRVLICFSFFAKAQYVHVVVASVQLVLYNRTHLKDDVNNKIELKTFHIG